MEQSLPSAREGVGERCLTTRYDTCLKGQRPRSRPRSRTISPRIGCSPRPTSSGARRWSSDPGVYERAEADWQGFWAEQAGALDWFRPWDTVLEWDLPFARWFDGGTLNVSYNCLDRHVAAGRGDKVAFHWEGEPGDTRTITYGQLLADVSRFANILARPRRRARRPGGHLHADDPRAAGGHAGLHPDRSRPLGRVRRLLVRRAPRQDPRRAGPGGDHRRRWLAPGCAGRPQGQRRRRRAGVTVRGPRGRGAPDRGRRQATDATDDRGPRPLVARTAER